MPTVYLDFAHLEKHMRTHLHRSVTACLAFACAILLMSTPVRAVENPLSVYQIGNSWTVINFGTWDIARSLQQPFTNGCHFAWNQPLKSIWAGTGAGAAAGYSPAPLYTALADQPWDIVTLQPWYETWEEAATAAGHMMDLAFQANPNAKILIFAVGPESWQLPYLATWERTDVENYTQQNFWKSKKNYELIVESLRASYPGKKIGIIPMAHCIAQVAKQLQNGAVIPNVASVEDLLEMGGQHTSVLGSYIGDLASYCTIFQQRPHGCAITGINSNGTLFSVSPEFAAYMWDLVWDVVLNEPYSLVVPPGPNGIGAFSFGNLGLASISGNNISITIPYGTAVTALSPTFNLSTGATSFPVSGSTHDFTSPVMYTVSTADPASSKTYTVTVTVAPYEPPIIGVQRAGGTGGGGIQLTPDQRAGAPGYAQMNWNVLNTFANEATGLIDSKGTATTVGFTTTAGGISPANVGNPSVQPDEILHSTGQYITWGDTVIAITGIPYASYSLVFYKTSPYGHGAQATILAGGPTYYQSQTHAGSAAGYVDGVSLTPFTYVQATSTDPAAPTVDGNYVVFSGLTGPNQTVTIPGGFQVLNVCNAFQIVSQPAGKPGDVNGDGVVNAVDLGLVKSQFGRSSAGGDWLPACDLNNDFRVDALDVRSVLSHQGE